MGIGMIYDDIEMGFGCTHCILTGATSAVSKLIVYFVCVCVFPLFALR